MAITAIKDTYSRTIPTVKVCLNGYPFYDNVQIRYCPASQMLDYCLIILVLCMIRVSIFFCDILTTFRKYGYCRIISDITWR